MRKVWTKELDRYLKANYMQLSTKQLVEKINFKFGLNITDKAINCRRIKLNLKVGLARPKKYTDEVRDYIINNYEGKSNIQLAKEINDKFGLNVNNNGICMYKANLIRRYGINTRTGINEGCYQKGNIPINKGTKGIFNIGGNSGSFKKGNKPVNWVPIGTERIGKDGYIEIKSQDGKLNNNWEGKHRYLYKKYYGEIPENHIVIFLDGNIRNFNKENLIAITKNENARLNQNKLRFDDAEITKSAINLAKFIIKTNEIKNTKKQEVK